MNPTPIVMASLLGLVALAPVAAAEHGHATYVLCPYLGNLSPEEPNPVCLQRDTYLYTEVAADKSVKLCEADGSGAPGAPESMPGNDAAEERDLELTGDNQQSGTHANDSCETIV